MVTHVQTDMNAATDAKPHRDMTHVHTPGHRHGQVPGSIAKTHPPKTRENSKNRGQSDKMRMPVDEHATGQLAQLLKETRVACHDGLLRHRQPSKT